MPGRILVKKYEVKLKGSIMLPPSRTKMYEIGQVVDNGSLQKFGQDGKFSTAETYKPGDLVLFMLPSFSLPGISFDIKGVSHCFLNAGDVIARLANDTIEIKSFQITGVYVLLLPTLRQTGAIIIPSAAEEAKKENLHFSVLQTGRDVKESFDQGQEVFPDKGRINPLVIDGQDYAYVDYQFIYGSLSID
jgi:co-chaperonin GroES (HSP10)